MFFPVIWWFTQRLCPPFVRVGHTCTLWLMSWDWMFMATVCYSPESKQRKQCICWNYIQVQCHATHACDTVADERESQIANKTVAMLGGKKSCWTHHMYASYALFCLQKACAKLIKWPSGLQVLIMLVQFSNNWCELYTCICLFTRLCCQHWQWTPGTTLLSWQLRWPTVSWLGVVHTGNGLQVQFCWVQKMCMTCTMQ